MKTILTSSLGYFKKGEDGKRIPDQLFCYNGFLERLQKDWRKDAKVLIIAASADDYEKNDDICECYRKSFEMSGLGVAYMENCDRRNMHLAERLSEMDVVLLVGGHVPTQNDFFKQIHLKEKLADFDGTVLAWSAGSMNCAETVYAAPELDGEAIDPDYKRWVSGLGLTKINIFPHYQRLKDDYLDGFRVMEDIVYADSMGHEIIAMNDATYITIENGKHTLYGEAYRIKDGKIEMICREGMSFELN